MTQSTDPPTPLEIHRAEQVRRELLPIVNAPAAAAREEAAATGQDPETLLRGRLEREHGAVYDTAELAEHFEVIGFQAPLVVVRRRADGVRGSLYFTHAPRFYYGFEPYQGRS